MKKTFAITPEEEGQRIDRVLATRSGLTRTHIQRLIEEGRVTIDGAPVRPSHRARPGDVFSLSLPEVSPADRDKLIPEPMALDILYSDEHLIVVNKPAGLVVYPAAGHPSGTMMNGLAAMFRSLANVGGPLRPGVVHRLDKDTSGVMVVARTDEAYHHLRRQFETRTIERRYLTLVYGHMTGDEGIIEGIIGRSENDRKKMSTRVRRGKEALTGWRVVEVFSEASMLAVKLGTGRTHQIRVHMASVGHPVLGDRVYGKKTTIGQLRIPRQMLHAGMLGIEHPATGERMRWSAPMPDDMEAIRRRLIR